VQMCSR